MVLTLRGGHVLHPAPEQRTPRQPTCVIGIPTSKHQDSPGVSDPGRPAVPEHMAPPCPIRAGETPLGSQDVNLREQDAVEITITRRSGAQYTVLYDAAD